MKRIKLAIAAAVAVVLAGTGVAVAAGAGGVAKQGVAASEISIGTHNTHYGDGSFESFAGVIGWQEVESPAAITKLKNRLGAAYNHYLGGGAPASAIPLSWRVDRFAKLGEGSVQTHGGEAGVTPARYVNWVRLEIRGTGTQLIVVNTHFISGAWSGHPERQARWNTHYQVLHDKVAALKQSHPGVPIFVIGDFNRAKAMGMPSPTQWVPVAGGGVPIDHMYAPSNVSHTSVTRQPMWGSDHHAYKMSATI
ncbi:MAG: endonuclease/exonuclease/phosphatase family protein [Actinophytocola sp.]|uniref:endonuclease/exonuclease/phosphatase family protein n=1 Tax=Actinophytocola sp. TaxID=1872138 RepID=UPI003C79310E